MQRVLLVAPTVDPDDVGEAWVAFQWASLLSERHEVTLLTYRKRGKASAAGHLPRARVVEWLEPPLLGRAERLNSLLKPGYFAFAARARSWVRAALARGETFDVAHQPVPVAMRYPSPLTGLGIPYVMGPVGGGLESPATFEAEDTAPWWVGLRRLDGWRLRHDRWLRRTYEEAACVLGIAPYVGDSLAGLALQRLEYLSETGLLDLPDLQPVETHDGPVRLLFVGRAIRTKGLRDAVAAMAHLRHLDVHLDVVGDGFDLPACVELARSSGVSDRVTFHGGLPRSAVDTFYRAADVFVFPSYREPGGNVVFEAMSYALPLVVSGRGGPGAAVDDECAVRLPVVDPDQYARAIADAVAGLVTDPARRRAMGAAARLRVREVGLWVAKVEQVGRLYEELGRRG